MEVYIPSGYTRWHERLVESTGKGLRPQGLAPSTGLSDPPGMVVGTSESPYGAFWGPLGEVSGVTANLDLFLSSGNEPVVWPESRASGWP
jgi:hypothetical protein